MVTSHLCDKPGVGAGKLKDKKDADLLLVCFIL